MVKDMLYLLFTGLPIFLGYIWGNALGGWRHGRFPYCTYIDKDSIKPGVGLDEECHDLCYVLVPSPKHYKLTGHSLGALSSILCPK